MYDQGIGGQNYMHPSSLNFLKTNSYHFKPGFGSRKVARGPGKNTDIVAELFGESSHKTPSKKSPPFYPSSN